MAKKVLILLVLLLLAFINGVSWFYLKNNRPCQIKLESYAEDFELKIVDKEKWQYFIDQIGNCEGKQFTVYGIGGEKQARQVRSAVFEIDNVFHEFIARDENDEVRYSYDISLTQKGNQAKVEFYIPFEGPGSLEQRTNSALVLTSYSLFSGEQYTQVEERVVQFNSLDKLGLKYEKK